MKHAASIIQVLYCKINENTGNGNINFLLDGYGKTMENADKELPS
jgi:hypothetical protein